MSESIHISLDGSINNLTKEMIESESKKLGFKDPSKFVVYCVERIMFNKKIEKRYLIEIIVLCLVISCFVLLLTMFLGR